MLILILDHPHHKWWVTKAGESKSQKNSGDLLDAIIDGESAFRGKMKLFDYMFFRSVKYFLSFKDQSLHKTRGAVVVTVYESLLVYFLVIMPLEWLNIIPQVEKGDKRLSIVIAIALGTLNAFRYTKVATFERLQARWNSETIEIARSRGRWLIVLMILFPIAMIVIGNIMFG